MSEEERAAKKIWNEAVEENYQAQRALEGAHERSERARDVLYAAGEALNDVD